jgi:putative DNA primase/helicase
MRQARTDIAPRAGLHYFQALDSHHFRTCTMPGRPTSDSVQPTQTPTQSAEEEFESLYRLSQVRPQRVSWLWPGRIPLGKLTILDGDPGLGKSSVLLDIAGRVTTGCPMPDGSTASFEGPGGVLLLSAEDGVDDTIRPRLEAAGGDLDRVVALPFLPSQSGERILRIPTDVPFLGRLASRLDARLLVVDPLLAYLAPGINLGSDAGIRRALTPLALLAERLDTAVVLVRHLNKRAARNPVYRGGGSIGLIGAARSGLVVAPDPDDQTGASRVLATTKSNLGPVPPPLAYRLVPNENGVPVVVWDGPTEQTSASLLVDSSTTRDKGAFGEAKAVLGAILADGPIPADAVQRQAAQAGVGVSLLRRAKEALGVRSLRVGRPGEIGKGWVWALPALQSPAGSQRTAPPEHAS